jgi:putative ABC transport system permease protein
VTRLFRSDKLPPGVRRLFRLPWSRPEMRRDLDDEVRFHLQMRVDDLIALGMTDAEAQAEALRRLGDADELRHYMMRVNERRAFIDRAIGWSADWVQDVALAWRQARHNAGFTALAVVTLALGIGANTAIFTVVHRLLIAPLPYPDGNRIVMPVMQAKDGSQAHAEPGVVRAWEARAHTIGPLAGMVVDAMAVHELAEQDTVHAWITPNYLDVLGIRPELGRGFTPADVRGGHPTVAMITDHLWRRRYGSSTSAIGSVIEVDSLPYTIVGVTPPAMGDPASVGWPGARLHDATASIFLPTVLDSMGEPSIFARLRPGVSADAASRELQSIAETVSVPATRFGAPVLTCCARALRAQDLLDPGEVQSVKLLFMAVGVLLLIACANVASLLMSRAWIRRREFAVRMALGAGRGRLIRLILTESLTLAVAGGLLGVALAWGSLRVIIALRPPALDGLAGIRPEVPTLLWSLGISLATGLIFGSAPALFAGGRKVGDLLRGGGRTASGDRGLRRVRAAFIIAELAMALVLLTGAGLLVRSFIALEQVPLGFTPHGLVAVEVMQGYAMRGRTLAEKAAIDAEILRRLRATPGVVDAAVGTMPGDPWFMADHLQTEPDPSGTVHVLPAQGMVFATPDYFRVAGIPIVAGRLPVGPNAEADGQLMVVQDATAVPVEIVVDRRTANSLWPAGNAVGAVLRLPHPRPRQQASYIVVGVAGNVDLPHAGNARLPTIGPPRGSLIYEPRVLPGDISYLVRVSGSATSMVPELRRAVAGVNSALLVRRVTVGDAFIHDVMAPSEFAMALLGTFALIALLLSAVGLYGMIAYSVSQRTREIGIRMALGAEPRSIAGLVVGEGIRLAVAGVVLGAAGAFAGTRMLNGMLYDVGPGDPATFAAISALVVGIALAASYVPARRAVRVDPTEALRAD